MRGFFFGNLPILRFFIFISISIFFSVCSSENCKIAPVIHILQYPGCNPVKIPSFACSGKCTSYVQVSGSKMWQTERSCMCCQESGEREATVLLNCGYTKQKVLTKAPIDCMCRPCSTLEEGSIIPQEMAGMDAHKDMSMLRIQF